MSTPTLVRLKRRITDDPTDILILSAAKRSRSSPSDTGSNTDEPVRLLKLAGTVDKDADGAIEKIVEKKRVPNFEELKVSRFFRYLQCILYTYSSLYT